MATNHDPAKAIVQEKLDKSSDDFVLYLKNYYFTQWKFGIQHLFSKAQNQKRNWICSILKDVFPVEIIEIILAHIPPWELHNFFGVKFLT